MRDGRRFRDRVQNLGRAAEKAGLDPRNPHIPLRFLSALELPHRSVPLLLQVVESRAHLGTPLRIVIHPPRRVLLAPPDPVVHLLRRHVAGLLDRGERLLVEALILRFPTSSARPSCSRAAARGGLRTSGGLLHELMDFLEEHVAVQAADLC